MQDLGDFFLQIPCSAILASQEGYTASNIIFHAFYHLKGTLVRGFVLVPLTLCYLFINIDERFLWLRWVTKASESLCRATAGIFHAP